ncbi:MAG: OsmC family protein [Anaerolineaceae bacterium]
MNAKATWQGDMTFVGTTDSKYSVPMDAAQSAGGNDNGFRPTDLLRLGLAGCTGMDVISILRKKRVEVSAFEVRVKTQSAPDHPHAFTHIEVEYVVTGKYIDRADVERAVQLSEEKYCPAYAMFSKVAEMSHIITIIEA